MIHQLNQSENKTITMHKIGTAQKILIFLILQKSIKINHSLTNKNSSDDNNYTRNLELVTDGKEFNSIQCIVVVG